MVIDCLMFIDQGECSTRQKWSERRFLQVSGSQWNTESQFHPRRRQSKWNN